MTYTPRPKRQYTAMPAATVSPEGRRFGWRGALRFMYLGIFFGAPQSYVAWRWAIHGDRFVFVLISAGYTILFGIFCVIARPWERSP